VTGTVDRLVATTPTNFGVQRMLPPNAWKPDADSVLAAVAELGYDGIALGPPGYLGTRHELDVSLADRELVLVEAFLPFHFSRNDLFGEELAALQTALSLLADRAFSPFAVLSEGFREPGRWEQAGRVRGTEGERLPSARFAALVSNLHRAADACLDAGLRPVLHHHAGTLVETDYEIRRVVEAMDTDRVGLCLDTAHAWIGGADPLALVRDFGDIIRHVHVKDLSFQRLQQGTGLRHDLTQLTIEKVFVPLGTGDGMIAEAVARLERTGYRGWYVVEQDRLLFDDDALDSVLDDQRRNLEFLRGVEAPGA